MWKGLLFGILGAGALAGGGFALYKHSEGKSGQPKNIAGGSAPSVSLPFASQAVPSPPSNANTLVKVQGALGSIAGTAQSLSSVIGTASSVVNDLSGLFS